jgi:AcrR family transcriptional regulator
MTTPPTAAKRRKKARSYHHKDLRRALMDAALTYLEKHEITRLNMQVLARTAGVSAGAPYHHFTDKEAVIAALATEGFELLLARMGERKLADEPQRALAELARGYLEFAAENRGHYRLMFLPEWSDRERFVALHRAGGEALARFAEHVRVGLPHGAGSDVALSRALQAFALLHGFAELTAAKVLTSIPGAPTLAIQREQVVRRVVVLVYAPDLPALT